MAIANVVAANASLGATTTPGISKGAIANGHYAILFLNHDTAPPTTATPPSGWTTLGTGSAAGQQTNNSNDSTLHAWGKLITNASGEPSTLTVTLSGSEAGCLMGLVAYSGVDPTNPLASTPTWGAPAASASPATATLTPSAANAMLVAAYGADPDGSVTGTPSSSPTTWNERVERNVADTSCIYVEDCLLTGTPSNVGGQPTLSDNDTYSTFIVALRPADVTAPTTSSVSPLDAATGVAIDANVTATFNEALNPATVTTSTFTLTPTAGGSPVAANVSMSVGNTVATLNPTSDLAYSTEYEAALTTGIQDVAGNAFAGATWQFTTAAETDPPGVDFVFPGDEATGVAIDVEVVAEFDEALDPATVTTSTFTLAPYSGPPVAASVALSVGNTVATLTPDNDLGYSTLYEVALTGGIEDVAGNAFAGDMWTFTTEAEPDPPEDPAAPSAAAVVFRRRRR